MALRLGFRISCAVPKLGSRIDKPCGLLGVYGGYIGVIQG